MRRPYVGTAILGAALLLAACTTTGDGHTPASTPSAPAGTDAPVPPAETESAAPSPSAVSAGSADPVVAAPEGILPPGSVARVTADGLRLRAASPHDVDLEGHPSHDEVIGRLAAGDVVLIGSDPLAYVPPESSPDGRGWYRVHVGGATATSYIDGGLDGWVVEGEAGLEYLELLPVSCPAELTLETLLYPPARGVERDVFTTDWERLACAGERPLELRGVYEYTCIHGPITPYAFEPPWLATPGLCTGLFIDDIDDGFPRFGAHLQPRFPEEPTGGLTRGDVLVLSGRFDHTASSSCRVSAPPGFDGALADPEFVELFCREQFVVDDLFVDGRRDLAPLPWEIP